jgi:hypothetical protein
MLQTPHGVWGGDHLTVVPQVYKKQLFAASCAEKTHKQWSYAPLFWPDGVRFNCVLFKKLVLNIIQWHYIN